MSPSLYQTCYSCWDYEYSANVCLTGLVKARELSPNPQAQPSTLNLSGRASTVLKPLDPPPTLRGIQMPSPIQRTYRPLQISPRKIPYPHPCKSQVPNPQSRYRTHIPSPAKHTPLPKLSPPRPKKLKRIWLLKTGTPLRQPAQLYAVLLHEKAY